MCLLALLYRVAEDAPVVVAANREEAYARGGLSPRLLEIVKAVGGVDPSHGGTWLGVNARGVLVAVTNRQKSQLPSRPRSRGLLARDLLGCSHAAETAARAARELETGRYAGCNFLCADARDALIVHGGDWLRVRPLPPGIHVLANTDVNDPIDPRIVHASNWLAARSLSTSREALASLRQLCASHEPVGKPICFRHDGRGTVSSSLLALPDRLAHGLYLHAQGPPDTTPYEDVSSLLRQLVSS
jgi:uncharacterized protein with NRDE domain